MQLRSHGTGNAAEPPHYNRVASHLPELSLALGFSCTQASHHRRRPLCKGVRVRARGGQQTHLRTKFFITPCILRELCQIFLPAPPKKCTCVSLHTTLTLLAPQFFAFHTGMKVACAALIGFLAGLRCIVILIFSSRMKRLLSRTTSRRSLCLFKSFRTKHDRLEPQVDHCFTGQTPCRDSICPIKGLTLSVGQLALEWLDVVLFHIIFYHAWLFPHSLISNVEDGVT